VGAFVQGTDAWVDAQNAAVEVEIVAAQAGEFAPAASGPRGGDELV
jgi:hypothetical protein